MYAHNISIKVFSKPEDDINALRNALVSLLPFSVKEEKLSIKETKCLGFNNREITILEIYLNKEKHTNKFIKQLTKQLDDRQKEMLIRQREFRLDNHLNFFVRFDKTKLIKENKLWITDSGDCFHVRIRIAAFPKDRKVALNIIEKIFKEK